MIQSDSRYSLNDPTPPYSVQYPEDEPRAIERYTLTGQ
jgi:hypothetical protein